MNNIIDISRHWDGQNWSSQDLVNAVLTRFGQRPGTIWILKQGQTVQLPTGDSKIELGPATDPGHLARNQVSSLLAGLPPGSTVYLSSYQNTMPDALRPQFPHLSLHYFPLSVLRPAGTPAPFAAAIATAAQSPLPAATSVTEAEIAAMRDALLLAGATDQHAAVKMPALGSSMSVDPRWQTGRAGHLTRTADAAISRGHVDRVLLGNEVGFYLTPAGAALADANPPIPRVTPATVATAPPPEPTAKETDPVRGIRQHALDKRVFVAGLQRQALHAVAGTVASDGVARSKADFQDVLVDGIEAMEMGEGASFNSIGPTVRAYVRLLVDSGALRSENGCPEPKLNDKVVLDSAYEDLAESWLLGFVHERAGQPDMEDEETALRFGHALFGNRPEFKNRQHKLIEHVLNLYEVYVARRALELLATRRALAEIQDPAADAAEFDCSAEAD